jgi:hypothetical protein
VQQEKRIRSACAAVDAQRPVAQHSTAAAVDPADVAGGGFVEGGRRADSAAIRHSATPVEVKTGLDCCNSHTLLAKNYSQMSDSISLLFSAVTKQKLFF